MTQTASPLIRHAEMADLDAINDIYNHYVLHSTCTYQETTETMEGRRHWYLKHGPKHPVMVAHANGRILGWSSLSPFHPRSAFRHTVESSVYVHQDFHRRGIGSLLLQDLIGQARAFGHRAIMAGIDADQKASLRLHEKCGFLVAGHFRHVGFKFGRWLDVIYMELIL